MDNLIPYDENDLERFVLGQMADDDLDAFLAYQTLHPEVQADVAVVRERIRALRGAAPSAPLKPAQNWVWKLIIPLFLLGIAAIWFYRQEKPSPAPEVHNPATETSPPPAIQQPPIAQAPESLKTEKPRSLASSFRPNKALELQIGGGLRGDGFQFQITTPSSNQILSLQDGLVALQLSGKLQPYSEAAKRSFRVLIFDNQPTSPEAMHFEATIPIHFLTGAKEAGQFRLEEKMKLRPGLFYYIIEDDQGDWQYVNKFQVQ